jgi:multidrug efflux system membrane fusion protein
VTPQTGTVLLKTRVENKKEVLWPGQFVSVRIVLKIEPEAVVVPEAAVQPGQDSSFVYLIDEESRVQVRPVKISRQIGNDVVIASGVSPGDQVITEIPQALQTGAAVRVADADGKPGEKKKGKGKGKGKKKADAEGEGSGEKKVGGDKQEGKERPKSEPKAEG